MRIEKTMFVVDLTKTITGLGIILSLSPVMVCGLTEEKTRAIFEKFDVGELNVSFSGGQEEAMYIYVDETLDLNVTILSPLEAGTIVFQSSNAMVFELENNEDVEITSETDFPLTIPLQITGKFLGIEKLRGIHQSEGEGIQIIHYVIKVKRLPVFTQSFVKYVMTFWMVFSYITMGAKSDISVIKEKLTRPWAVLIGMTCQFLIMPSLAFGLSLLFAIDDSAAVGLIVDGSCPGGWLSNALSVLLDLDFVLSLTMTFCSTFLALGLMPLNLFIYTTSFTSENKHLRVPYLELIIQLFILIIPIGIGLLLVAKFPKLKNICDKILKPVATVLVAIGIAVTLPFDYYCFLSGINVYGAALTLPFVGGSLGLALAKLACLKTKAAITVAIETGCQNALLALTMVRLFYPLPEADLVSRVPLLVVIFTLIEGLIITGFYLLYKKVYLGHITSESEAIAVVSINRKPVVDETKEMKSNKMVDKVDKSTQSDGVQNQAFQLEEEMSI